MPLPLMPSDSSMVAGPAGPSGLDPSQMPGLGPQGDILSMLGGGSVSSTPPGAAGQMQGATANAMNELGFLEQKITELMRAFPGNEQAAQIMLEGLNLWKQGVVTSMSVPAPLMPGADQML